MYQAVQTESTSGRPVTTLRSEAIALIWNRGYERREQPFKLASGQMSHDYIDGKYAVDRGAPLQLLGQAIVELADAEDMSFTSVGGLTMGADALAHGVAIVSGSAWFSVRKEPKPRGREQWIEGARLGAEDRVLLVDDVVTSGGSIIKAYKRVVAVGARVIGVIPMVDRGDMGALRFAELGVPYAPLATYHDLGIEPVIPPLESSQPVDQTSLRRLAEQGLAAFPPTAIGSLAGWCWDMGETTGDARYSSLWRALSWIDDLFIDQGGVPTEDVERFDTTLREWIPAILDATEPAEGAHFGRLMREEFVFLVG